MLFEETVAGYLSMGEAPALKDPSLPTKPLRVTSRLNGRAYAAAGQAAMAVTRDRALPEAVEELRRTTDLALLATKQTWWLQRGIYE